MALNSPTGDAHWTGRLALESADGTQTVHIPSMTTAQRDAIVGPTKGMLIYNTTTNKLNVRAAAAWEAVTSA